MGNFLCDSSPKLKEEKIRQPSFLKSYNTDLLFNKSKSKIFDEDKHYFFENEVWFKDLISQNNNKTFLNVHLFIETYEHYKIDQLELEKHWKKQDIQNLSLQIPMPNQKDNNSHCLVPKWKFLIRKGVPMKNMRFVVLSLFKKNLCNNDFEYQAALNSVFKGRVPTTIKNCPSFSEKRLEELLPVHFLTEDGFTALKRILVVLQECCFFLEYSPMIPAILSLLLIFLTEAEAYCCIQSMAQISKLYFVNKVKKGTENNLRNMRWYFTLESKDFLKLCDGFFQEIQANDEEFNGICKHLANKEFPFMKVFENWTTSLFLGHLPLTTALKTFIGYLNEGVKIYFRVSYGVCYLLKEAILESNTKENLQSIIKERGNVLDIVESHQLLRISYALVLSNGKKSFRKDIIKVKPELRKSMSFFRPRFNNDSAIITNDKHEILWDWLPGGVKLRDAKLLFSTQSNGFSLSSMYNVCLPYHDKPMLLLIRNDKNWVFGAYCDQNFLLGGDSLYRGSHASFVFALSPIERKFESTGANLDHMRCDSESFSFGGGGDGVAFCLDSDLNNGHTYKSETYENDPFNGSYDDSRFMCLDFEIFVVE